jgi:site-specific DNA-methyltransferase (adenine-specific)
MTELNRIINADCMEIMKDIPDKYFELAIVDPPYGIKQDGRKNHTRGKKATPKDYTKWKRYDDGAPDADYFCELLRVSKNQIIFGANHFISRIPRDSSCWIVWDKDNGRSDFADCELAWTSFNSAVRKFKWRWQGMLQENMSDKDKIIHPNQKPLALMRWLLMNYAKAGDRILDTHSGSGSLACACHLEGFDFLAIEIDPHTHSTSIKRIDELRSQGTLF